MIYTKRAKGEPVSAPIEAISCLDEPALVFFASGPATEISRRCQLPERCDAEGGTSEPPKPRDLDSQRLSFTRRQFLTTLHSMDDDDDEELSVSRAGEDGEQSPAAEKLAVSLVLCPVWNHVSG